MSPDQIVHNYFNSQIVIGLHVEIVILIVRMYVYQLHNKIEHNKGLKWFRRLLKILLHI